MAELLEKLLGGTIAVFMAGSLLEMGLKLDLKQAGHAFRDVRFVVTALFWSFARTIARPLLFFIALPLAIGICVRLATGALADKSHPIVKKGTSLDIILMLGIVLLLYWRDFLSAVGTYAIGAQILYYCLLAAAAYGLGFGLSHEKRSTLVLGLCTRNVGAAIAPLLSMSSSDQRATVMCIMAVFITLGVGFGVAYLLGRWNPASKSAHGGG
jgi:BASS family bile acid:Na+ symporter